MKTRAHVVISGRVHGVWFRASTQEQAEQRGLTGWVKNTHDGKVEAVFEGEEERVKDMIAWCHKGPQLAKVTKVHVKKELFAGNFTEFSIVR